MTQKATYEELEQRVEALNREITTYMQWESERQIHLRFLEIMDKIDQIIRNADDIGKMMKNVFEAVLTIFQCDRVWIMYPCDPEADCWRVPMECTRPEYPVAFALNQDVPMTAEMVASCKAVLQSKGPLVFHPEHGLPLPDAAEQFLIKSSIKSALYPKVGKPWMWGLSQCSHARQWTEADISIFQEIGRRISDSLTSLLTLRSLKESEEKYRHLSEGTFEAVVWHDEGRIIEANEQYYKMFGYTPDELAGTDAILLTATPDSVKFIKKQIASGNLGPYEVVGMKKDVTEFPMEVRVKTMPYKGKTARLAAIRDLTERKRTEEALERARNELESRVAERTRELESKAKSLEELNTAMKVLLKKREEDKTEVEQNVMANVRELIAPYFDKINETRLDDYQKALLNILELNLNEIVSPFTRKLSLKYLSLTPKEIQIVNMVKIGYSSKKIARIMNVSPRTIDTHRKNIRNKIGLGKKRASLRSYLLAYEQ